jgi:hypothetical protein
MSEAKSEAKSEARSETDSLKRPFLIGLLAVAIAFVLLGGIIAAFGTRSHRSEGIAERWLTEVGDTSRKGVGHDARIRADKLGPVSLAASLLPPYDFGGKSAFSSLEVGKAVLRGSDARVPFLLRLRVHPGGDTGERTGTIVLQRRADTWRVAAVQGRDPGRRVPSEGGAPVSHAPPALYLGALIVGIGVAAACSALVRAATPLSQRRAST